MKEVLFIPIMILFIRCEKFNDQPIILPKLTEYNISAMFYPAMNEDVTEFCISPERNVFMKDTPSNVKIEYNDNNQIVHRIGNLGEPGSNSIYYFHSENSDMISYKDNVVEVARQYRMSAFPDKRLFYFEKGRIIRKSFDYGHDGYNIDYKYNRKHQLTNTSGGSYKQVSNADYQYDKNGNLTLITSATIRKSDNIIVYTDSLWFSDYDNAPNLCKDLIIFGECYYRALSSNNFRKYRRKRVDSRQNITIDDERTWQFKYDENGYPIY